MIDEPRGAQNFDKLTGCMPTIVGFFIWVIAMNYLIENWQEIAGILGIVITLAHAVTEFSPTPADDAVFAKVYTLLEVIGLKLGKSRKANRIRE